ncbi:hypothetical protein [Streptomyces aureoversilis]|uniref:Glycosyltransferase n=1 Tax=Streptomyces aureoversilis TaxID=67277 RepID=A0ABV9ZTN9_9ACTN
MPKPRKPPTRSRRTDTATGPGHATAREPLLLAHIRRRIARGYRPTSTWDTPVDYLAPGGFPSPRPGGGGIGLVMPTQVTRATPEEQREMFRDLLKRVGTACRAHPDVRLVLMIGMQWQTPEQRHEARRRLGALVEMAADGPEVVGLLLRGPLKVRTLNAAISVAERLGLDGIGWMDDDVRMEEECLARLVTAFREEGCRGAVGATKIPHSSGHLTSRILHRAKAVAAPATNYPHGCCILVATAVVAGGIPDRYVSDDGYVCFRLLDPGAPDPLHRLRLVPGARVHYQVAGPAGATRRRIRRLLLNHHIYLADWSYPTARYYFREILFLGMWPLARWDHSQGVRFACRKAAIKWLYFLWFGAIGAELYLRGLFGRPLREVAWSGYPTAGAPGRGTTPATAERDLHPTDERKPGP